MAWHYPHVTEEEFQGVLRDYLKLRIERDFDNNMAEMARRTGIDRPVITQLKNGDKGISIARLIEIAETVGPSFPKMLTEIAEMCGAAEVRHHRQRIAELATGKGVAAVRAEDAELLEAVASTIPEVKVTRKRSAAEHAHEPAQQQQRRARGRGRPRKHS